MSRWSSVPAGWLNVFVAPLGLGILLGVLACGDDEVSVGAAGGGCAYNSECSTGLICGFGRCHDDCKESLDCPERGQRCVYDRDGTAVCLLPEEDSCSHDSQCEPLLVCAQDLKCRNQCFGERDCPKGQRCVPSVQPRASMVCADPDELENGRLQLLVDAGPQGPSSADGGMADGGAGSDAGVAGTGGGGGAGAGGGGSASMDGGVAGAPGSADGGTSDAGAMDGAAPADSGPPAGEVEPNDSNGEATPYTLGEAVPASIGVQGDVDYFEIAVPADSEAGGYFTGSITAVQGGGAAYVTVFDAETHAQVVFSNTNTANASVYFFWAAAAGRKYHVEIKRAFVLATTFDYTLRVEYTAIVDPSEPNQTRDTPAPIALGAAVEAHCFAGFEGALPARAEYADWYVIDTPLEAGTLTVQVASVPTNVALRVTAYDENNAPLTSPTGEGTAGVSINAPFSIANPGTYRVLIEFPVVFLLPEVAGKSQTIPDHFVQPYRLTVSQP